MKQFSAETVAKMYESGMTQAEIGKELGVSQKTVWKFMRSHGIKARKAAKRYQLREKNASWRGGRRIENGYVQLYMPDYPKAKQNGYVYEHIYIAEQMLGRPLKSFGIKDDRTEVVHHINGIKTDNRKENLLVIGVNEHHRLHSAVTKEAVDGVLLERIRQLECELRRMKTNEQDSL